MKDVEFYTIGVYGTTAEEFKEKLLSNHIDTFIDIRNRRAVRGSRYVFANSNRLQANLHEMGIKYVYVPELSTPPDIIAIQKEADRGAGLKQSERDHLNDKFITEYKKRVLDSYDFKDLFSRLDELGSKKAVLFCVEANPKACHRSLVAGKLKEEFKVKVKNI